MIQINQLKLAVNHNEGDLFRAVKKALRPLQEDFTYEILKKSLDARKKPDLKYIYSVGVDLKNRSKEEKLIQKLHNNNMIQVEKKPYQFPITGTESLTRRPIVVGSGPCGLFAGLMLARNGYRPLILERGADVDQRVKDIEQFWESNELHPNSNVQFGEGGAGTFSDGKLNTLVKDKSGLNRKVLETFVEFGAPKEILYWNKPHIGTDLLRGIIKNMRKAIEEAGGEVRFHSQVTDIRTAGGCLSEVVVNEKEVIPCDALLLAVGHSARDTFQMLLDRGLSMEQKAFAIGVRIEHEAQMINESQYGRGYDTDAVPTADYKLVHHASNGRSVYSFCMCPGGYVVNSSSEPGRIVVNGMSNYKRDAGNSNSAIIVNVAPEDFEEDSPLAGVHFQQRIEEAAYRAGGGNGNVPVQLFGDLCAGRPSSSLGGITPSLKGRYHLSDLRQCLPPYVIDAIIDGIMEFDHKIKGFAREDSVLSGVETRTSSPVRIHRNECYISNISGIYPCGEGAGYAGGITSAAMDGIRTAEALARVYIPFHEK